MRSAGGIKAVEAMLLQPGGLALIKGAATKQKSEAGKSYNNNNNNNLDMSGTTATPP